MYAYRDTMYEIKFLIYVMAYIAAILFRKEEHLVTFAHGVALVMFASLNLFPLPVLLCALALGVFFSILVYVCVKLDMIHFAHAKYTLPHWFPLSWAIVSLCFLDAFNIVSSKL